MCRVQGLQNTRWTQYRKMAAYHDVTVFCWKCCDVIGRYFMWKLMIFETCIAITSNFLSHAHETVRESRPF